MFKYKYHYIENPPLVLQIRQVQGVGTCPKLYGHGRDSGQLESTYFRLGTIAQ